MKKRMAVGEQLGKRVRELRKSRRLTQAQLADKAKLHAKFMSDVEVGTRDVRLSTLSKLARGLGVTLHELFRTNPEDEMLGEIERLLRGRDEVVRAHLLRWVKEALQLIEAAS